MNIKYLYTSIAFVIGMFTTFVVHTFIDNNPGEPIQITSSIPESDARSMLMILESVTNHTSIKFNADTTSMAVPIYGTVFVTIKPITELKKGMVVVFELGADNYVIHQIKHIKDDWFIPAGTNNSVSDGWVHNSAILGELTGLFPYNPS